MAELILPIDPMQLNDEELRIALQQYLPNVGPVVDSTRSTLRSLLIRKLESGPPELDGPIESRPMTSTPPKGHKPRLSVSFAPDEEIAAVELIHDDDDEDYEELNQTATDLTEAAIEQADLSPASRRRMRHITVEEEPQTDNFFVKALISGILVMILAVLAMYVLRWATDY